MAIYHCTVKMLSRSHKRSSVAAAAYRAGIKLMDAHTGIIHDYTAKGGVDHSVILAPVAAPAWVQDRGKLWNAVESVEKRKDSQLCREIEVALPRELTLNQQIKLIEDYARAQFVAAGMIADLNIHHSAGENPHCHILLSTRSIGPEGFAGKNREWNRRELIGQWRESWEKLANQALSDAGHLERIDHRTLADQGINRIPGIHVGPRAQAMERRGYGTTGRGDRARSIEVANLAKAERAANSEIEGLARERREMDATTWMDCMVLPPPSVPVAAQDKEHLKQEGVQMSDETPVPIGKERIDAMVDRMVARSSSVPPAPTPAYTPSPSGTDRLAAWRKRQQEQVKADAHATESPQTYPSQDGRSQSGLGDTTGPGDTGRHWDREAATNNGPGGGVSDRP